MNELSRLTPPKGAVKGYKRVGRGSGSGLGKTSGLGQKGSLARAGMFHAVNFEGGQMPLQRRIPKRGFSNSVSRMVYVAVNVGSLNRLPEGSTVDVAALERAGLAKGQNLRVKLTGDGELTVKLTIKADRVSTGEPAADREKSARRSERLVVTASAAEKIRAAGGTVEVG